MGSSHSHTHEAKKTNYQVKAEERTRGAQIKSNQLIKLRQMDYENARLKAVAKEKVIEKEMMEGQGLKAMLEKEVTTKACKLVALDGSTMHEGDKTVLIGYEDLQNKRDIIDDVMTLFSTCPKSVQEQVGDVATQCVSVMARHASKKGGRMTDLVNCEYNTRTFSAPIQGVETKFMFEWIVAFKYMSITQEKAKYLGIIGTKRSELTRVGVSYKFQINNCGRAPTDGSVLSIHAKDDLAALGF